MKSAKAFFAVFLALMATFAQGQLLEVVRIDSVYIAQLEKLNKLLVRSAKLDSANFAEKLNGAFTALGIANTKILTLVGEKEAQTERAISCEAEIAPIKEELYKYKPRTLAGRILRKARDGLAVVGGVTILVIVPLLIPK